MALLSRSRTEPDAFTVAVETALDLTPLAVTLYERAAAGGWRKFASVALNDPEFQIVIGLLRSEAEARCGRRIATRLWLPGDQILKRTTRLRETDERARLRAAFRFIADETEFNAAEVAIAVAPANRHGETTILITYAQTWREARDYASRWGFRPGVISTRTHAVDFGPEGPAFRLRDEPRVEPVVPRQRHVLAGAAVLAAVSVVALAAWFAPWKAWIGTDSRLPTIFAPEAAEQQAAAPDSALESARAEAEPTLASAPAAQPVPQPRPVSSPETGAAATPLVLLPEPAHAVRSEEILAAEPHETVPGAPALDSAVIRDAAPMVVAEARVVGAGLARAPDRIPTPASAWTAPDLTSSSSTPTPESPIFDADAVARSDVIPHGDAPQVVAEARTIPPGEVSIPERATLRVEHGLPLDLSSPVLAGSAPAFTLAAWHPPSPGSPPPVSALAKIGAPEPLPEIAALEPEIPVVTDSEAVEKLAQILPASPLPRSRPGSGAPEAEPVAEPVAEPAAGTEVSPAPGFVASAEPPFIPVRRPQPAPEPEIKVASIEPPVVPVARPALPEAERAEAEPEPRRQETTALAALSTAEAPQVEPQPTLPPYVGPLPPLPPRRPGGSSPAPVDLAATPSIAVVPTIATAPAATGVAVPSAPPVTAATLPWVKAPDDQPAPTQPTTAAPAAGDSRLASLSAPPPPVRPKIALTARTLPSVAALPSIAATAPRSVRAAATEQGLPLDRTSLIGVINLDSGRKALLRLPNGRYQSVSVGDELEGWKVSAIGVDAMRVSRGGEDRTLLLVNR